MKNYLMFALLIGATASMAFGQFGVVVDPLKTSVVCPEDECHVAPVFMGEGGFVGEMSGVSDMVTFVVECGNTITEGTASGDSNGVVTQLFSMDNGLACLDEDGGSIQIHGLADGGWYWINDVMSSAVSPLLAKDTLGNAMIKPTNPGGLMLTESDYGTFVKHEASGRVGILPHVVPEPEVEIPDPPAPEAATICGPRYWAPSKIYYLKTTGCMMGDGGTKIVLTGPRDSVGRDHRITNGMFYRPLRGSSSTISFGLWGNGSGHISVAPGAIAGANTAAALQGWDMSASGGHTPTPFTADFKVDLVDVPNGDLESAGIAVKEGDVISRVTPMEHVPAGNSNVDSTAWIDNGFGTYDNKAVSCTQKHSRDEDDTLLIHFAGVAGELMVDPTDTDNPSGDTTLGPDDDWATQAAWVAVWNSNADDDELISRYEHDPDQTVADDEYQLPKVICAEREGDVKEVKGTGSIEVMVSDDHCKAPNNHTVKLRIRAVKAATNSQNPHVVPPFQNAGKVGGTDQAAITYLSVMCPPATAAAGTSLIPPRRVGGSRGD